MPGGARTGMAGNHEWIGGHPYCPTIHTTRLLSSPITYRWQKEPDELTSESQYGS